MSSRYHRQQQVPQFGAGSQSLLAAAKVLIVGAGGLGSPVANLLVGAGVGQITLIDHDTVDISNLHRQTLFTEANIGQPKAQAAKERLQASNSEVLINAIVEPLNSDNAKDLVAQHTVVVDAADSFFVSYLLSDFCLSQRIPLVAASVLQTGGYVGVFCGSEQQPAPSMRAIFPAPPLSAQNCNTAGVTGPSVGIIGSYQAQEVLKVILQDPEQLLGRLMYLDLWSYSQNILSFENAPEPERHAALISEADIKSSDLLLDVRSVIEVADEPRVNTEAKLVSIPVDELAKRWHELDQAGRVVCVCKSGQRALNAAHQLFEFGFKEIGVAL